MTRQSLHNRLLGRPAWQFHATGATLLIVISAIAYVFQIGPLLGSDRRRATLEAEIAEQDNRARRVAVEVRQMRDRAATAESYVRERHLALRSRSELNRQLSALTELATASGLQADGIEPGGETAGVKFSTVVIRLTARGTAAQVMRFLATARERMPDAPVVAVEMTASPSPGPAAPAGPCTFEVLWFTAGGGALASN